MNRKEIRKALTSATEAHRLATEALASARAAARAAGVEDVADTPAVLDVHRINVREKDGTLRLVIGNSEITRTLPVRGREIEHPARVAAAGILFVNDEGTESGGLVTRGRTQDGDVRSLNYLSFDAHEQNETLRLGRGQEGDQEEKFLEFRDAPDWSLADMIEDAEQRGGEVFEAYAARGGSTSRMLLSREEDGSVGLRLRDGEGRDRIRLLVTEDGESRIERVDADGTCRAL